jgi:adenine-specific DNA-methyltransferase
MPIEILGNIYEQFLGKTIKFRNVRGGHTAIIEEKLEVRKAGGVYYTPQYIVDYIVKSTIGEKIKNKKPKEISKIKICDPACGSGSFLVGAYQFLLNYHLDYYTKIENLSKSLKNNKIYQISENDYRLPIEEKQRILVNNIYGVDIDLQAVEVTKLSLYLKLLENESKESEGYLFKHTDLKLLPKLDKNIKCGNSLINSDFYSNKDLSLFGNEEMRKINVFDWDKEFKEIFEDKGFDIVIGNPPYVSVELMSTEDKQYYKKFDTFIKRGDLFSLFLDHASATISKGYVSFIVPSIVLNNLSYKKLRERFLRNKILKEVCYTGGKIFDGVTVDTVILIIDLDKVNEIKLINALDFDEHIIHTVEIGYFEKYNNNISVSNLDSSKICDKIFIEDFDTVENHFTVFQGIVTGNNEAFIFENEKEALDKGIEKELLKPLCHGRDIEKWVVKNLDRRIMYINSSININKFPGAHNWLKQHKTKLETRRECKNGAIPWYSLQWARNVNELNIIPKIAIQNTRNERLKTRIIAALDEKSFYSSQGINFIIPKSNEISILFLLGILNSKLINYLFQTKFLNLAIKAEYLKKLKIPNNNQEELEKIVSLMIETQKQYHSSQSVNDKKIYKQKIDMIDNQIDQMVYKLYALTDEEIKIVEEN